MKTRNLVVLLIGIMLISVLVADDSYSQLQERIDLLEAKLENIEVEQIRSNPYANGETSDWGTGFFMNSKTGAVNSWNLELGHMFKVKGNAFGLLSKDYISKRNSYRLGFSAGAQWFDKEIVYNNNSTFYNSSGYGFYGKFITGSPILLNFMSFSGHLKAMYTIPGEDKSHNIEDARMVYGFGNDVEFWLTKNSCVTVGYTEESDSVFEENENDRIYPSKIRFVFGFKSHF
jgi:hypothetical protein